jgi:hypothetical protein
MNFAVPSAIMLGALALPIIAFYILKVRMRRVRVSTNLFWKQIFEEKPPRSIWQNFRHWLSLLIQLILLASLILAFADPYMPWQILQARRIVLIVDPSASMQGTDVVPTRLDAALQAGKGIVQGLRFRDQLAIVLSGSTPEVVVGMTGHSPTLLRALAGIHATDTPTELEDAIDLGKQLVGSHPFGQVIVLTDGCHSSLRGANEPIIDQPTKEMPKESSSIANGLVPDRDTSKPAEIQYRIFATQASNVGIHQFQVRRSLIDPIGYEVLAGVSNASDNPIKCRLELTLDEAVVDVIPLELKANEKWSRSIEKTSLQGGVLKAELGRIESPEDAKAEVDRQPSKSAGENKLNSLNALASDDVAWAVLPSRSVQKVLIVSPGNVFLTKVFEANPLVEVTTLKEPPTTWPSDSLIVLHQLNPTVLPDGKVLVIDPIQECDLWGMGDAMENPIITEIDKGSPLMHHIRLDNVLIPDAKKLLFKTPIKSLAGTLDATSVYSFVNRPNGKCLVLSVGLERSDIAFRTVFPILIANALGFYAGNAGELLESQPTGSSIEIVVQQGTSLVLQPPNVASAILGSKPSSTNEAAGSAKKEAAPTNDSTSTQSLHLGPLDRVGVWGLVDANALPAQKAPTKIDSWPSSIAVNLASAHETDMRPDPKWLEQGKQGLLGSNAWTRPIWFYLVAFASILVTLEWFMYQRRIIT